MRIENDKVTVDFRKEGYSGLEQRRDVTVSCLRVESWLLGTRNKVLEGDFNYKLEVVDDGGLTVTGTVVTGKFLRAQESDFGTSGSVSLHGLTEKAADVTFQLIFHPNAISNCPQQLDVAHTYPMKLRLTLSEAGEGDAPVLCEEAVLNVEVPAYRPKIKFCFIPQFPKESSGTLLYQPDMPACIRAGVLRVQHVRPFKCAPAIRNINFSYGVIKTSFDAKDQPTEECVSQLLRFCDVDVDGFERIDGEHGRIKYLASGGTIDIPMELQTGSVFEPASAKMEDVYTPYVSFVEHGMPKTFHLDGFSVCRDPYTVRAEVLIGIKQASGEPKWINITNNWMVRNEGVVSLINDFDISLILKIRNQATACRPDCPDASVLFWGLRISDVSLVDKVGSLALREGSELRDIVRIDGLSPDSPIVLGPNEERSFDLKVNNRLIEAIVPDPSQERTRAEVRLVLEYFLIEDQKGANKARVEAGDVDGLGGRTDRAFQFELCRTPQSGWFCVDYGTSAVVAGCSESGTSAMRIIDLKNIKDRLMLEAYPDRNDIGKRRNDDETDCFVASTICLNNNNQEQENFSDVLPPEQYRQQAVWFSPSAGSLDVNYQLSCMKTLMGYPSLPDMFSASAQEKFRYKVNGVERRLYDENNEPTELMRVDEIFRLVYKQLFEYYMSHDYSQDGRRICRRIEKLVISVPNTYTPLNLDTITRLAREAMPYIYPEYLCTVSESDAVACYYVSKQKELIESVSDFGRRSELRKKQHVLVYDMGAGTLDLTLFEYRLDRNTAPAENYVSILGKMGVNKAGNYLDYELACILVELCRERNVVDDDDLAKLEQLLQLDLDEGIANQVSSGDRLQLKNYVKELKKQLKPGVADPLQNLTLADSGVTVALQQLTTADIMNRKRYKAFIKDITEGVLGNFIKLFGGDSKKIDLDVVVFSGRSTALGDIREGVKACIGNFCNQPAKLLYGDISSDKLFSDLSSLTADSSKLKTVVTRGSLAYATMFNVEGSHYHLRRQPFYAQYGVVVVLRNGDVKWYPLVGYNVSGTTSENGQVVSRTVTFCEGSEILFLDLIQSYSASVVDDYKNGNFDTISKLGHYTLDPWPNKFDFSLTMYDEVRTSSKSVLKFMLMGHTQDRSPHDDFDNPSLRKSLWPVVYRTKK